jgi:hypothetical protein
LSARPGRTLLLAVALACGLPLLVQLALGTPTRDTLLFPLQGFLRGEQLADSWRPLRKSFEFVGSAEGNAQRLYDKMFWHASGRHKGLQYPPTALLPLFGLRAVLGADWSPALEWVTWCCIPATLLALVGLARRVLPTPPDERVFLLSALALATLTFFPIMIPYRGGQIQTWLNLLFALALWAWCAGRSATAGVLVGLIALIKPQLGLLFLWGLLRGRTRFVFAGTLTGVLGLSLSCAWLGLDVHRDYVAVLRFVSERGESFFPNQCMNGLLHRALGNGENLHWTAPGAADDWMAHFPPYHPGVHAGTLLSSAVLLAAALGLRPAGRARGGALDFAFMALCATCASPIAWEHHYGILLPIFLLLAAELRRLPGVRPGRDWALLALCYVLTANPWRLTRAWADTPFGVLQSYLFLAVLVLLALLASVRARDGAAAAPAPAS